MRLCASLSGVEAHVPADQTLPDFDLYCPMASLPLALGTVAGVAKDRLRVGLVWVGNPSLDRPALAAHWIGGGLWCPIGLPGCSRYRGGELCQPAEGRAGFAARGAGDRPDGGGGAGPEGSRGGVAITGPSIWITLLGFRAICYLSGDTLCGG